jgi:hypothetical protein
MPTSEDVLTRLNKKLDAKQSPLALYEQYYQGNHRLSFATSKFRETFGNLFSALAVNFCLLVVDAERERLNVEGFRFHNQSNNPREAEQADTEAWRIWQANRLDARSSMAHAEALSKGEAFVLVWTNPLRTDTPLIRVQDARKVVVEYDDGDADKRTVAMKRWVDTDSKREYATLYYPDRLEKYQSAQPMSSGTNLSPTRNPGYWERRNVPDEAWPLPNPMGTVPMVPLLNNPLLEGVGRSELQSVIPIQDAINKLVADMLVASEYVAYPQRWATGIEVPTDPVTGQPMEPFKAGAGRLWVADVVQGLDQPIEPKFGEFPQANLEPYTSAIEMLVQQIASITKTPAHYLLGQSGSFPSGESLKATETGLTAKANGAMRYFGEGWEEVMRLAFTSLSDDTRAKADAVEVIWADPESRSIAEVTDAMGKQVAQLGVPKRIAWEKVGYSQVEIARMEVLSAQEGIQTAALLPAVAGPSGTGGAAPAAPVPATLRANGLPVA